MIYLVYRDKGPSGFCPQSGEHTSPWNDLLVFEREDNAMQFLRLVEQGIPGRLKAEITGFFSTSYQEDGHGRVLDMTSWSSMPNAS